MLKISIVVISLFLAGCVSSGSSYSTWEYFSITQKLDMEYQISKNSQNIELYDVLTQLKPSQRRKTIGKVEKVLINPNSNLKSISDAEMVLALLLLKDGDKNSAFQYLKSSAEKNNGYAQYEMALYYKGITHNQMRLPRNDAVAFSYTKQSAENKFPKAQYSLAHLYLNGKGVRKDTNKAFYWIKKACENGHKEACNIYYEVVNEINNLKLNS